MSQKLKNQWLLIVVLFLFFLVIYIFYLDSKHSLNNLTLAVLDVGQGDAIFIESPTGVQILIDGGPPREILRSLPKVMSFFDKSIDAIIITNPDLDHIGGFLDILKMYKVGQVFESETFNESKTFENLNKTIKEKNITRTLAKRGIRLDLGGGAVLDFLFPDQDVSLWQTNDGSIVSKLSYGETSIMLTGDATSFTEKLILDKNIKKFLDSDILKVGHHGSYTSSSEAFVNVVSPSYALISVGKNNKYGHPHQETLDTLQSFGAEIFRTDLLGTIIMKSDGQNETFSFIK